MKQIKKQITENEKKAIRVTSITIIVNMILSIFKLFAGIISKSGAMISDAVHSASDVFSSIIVIIGVKAANKESDHNHQYGHERLECVAAIILAIILCITGAGIGYAGIVKILNRNYDSLSIPGILALIAAIVSIIVKEGMYWYTRATAKSINSSAMMADAWHHRSDAFSSIGSFVGILGARLSIPVFDPIASVIICLFIIKASIDIFMDAIRKMTDTACDDKTVDEMRSLILSQDGVADIDQLKTRIFGDKIYVDIEIQADGSLTLHQSHNIAQCVHDKIESNFTNVKHCMVHVNPTAMDMNIE